jgi:flagellar FliJ protein
MKKFRFEYESILKMRQAKEDDVKNELARLLDKLRTVKLEKEKMLKDQQSFFETMEDMMKHGCSASELRRIQRGQSYYRTHLKTLDEKILNLEKHVLETKQLLLEAVKAKKIMEKLKENAYSAFINDVNHEEQKVIEEIVNYKNNKVSGGENGR